MNMVAQFMMAGKANKAIESATEAKNIESEWLESVKDDDQRVNYNNLREKWNRLYLSALYRDKQYQRAFEMTATFQSNALNH